MTRNELIENNLRLVWYVVQNYFKADCDEGNGDDLFQVGCIGLVKAADGFDANRGIQFSTYACKCIWNEIMHYKRHNTFDLHVPPHYKPADSNDYKALSLDTAKNGDGKLLNIMIDEKADVEGEAMVGVMLDRALSRLRPRAREIAEAYLSYPTIRAAADHCGVSYQRVQQCIADLRNSFRLELAV